MSAATPWEIESKRGRPGFSVPRDLLRQVEHAGFAPLPVSLEHAVAAGRLPLHHRDPFDRMLVAQARLEGMTLVTNDEKIARYQVAVLPA